VPNNQKLRILCYDVSSNKRRRKVARRLEDVASRVQYSVFEARLSAKVLKRVVADVEKLLENGDSLRVYSVGKTGERYCEVHGTGVPVDKNEGFWLL
jgi:CRISPR-associated protein Cas2